MAACSGNPCRHSARRSPVPQLSTSKACPLTSIVMVSIAIDDGAADGGAADDGAPVSGAVRMVGCRAWCDGPCQDRSQTLTNFRLAGRVIPRPTWEHQNATPWRAAMAAGLSDHRRYWLVVAGRRTDPRQGDACWPGRGLLSCRRRRLFSRHDGGVALTAQEITGRNTWLVWSGGNDRFWDGMTATTFGGFDLLKTISSRPGLEIRSRQPLELSRADQRALLRQTDRSGSDTFRPLARQASGGFRALRHMQGVLAQRGGVCAGRDRQDVGQQRRGSGIGDQGRPARFQIKPLCRDAVR